jgi:hypothetical protein
VNFKSKLVRRDKEGHFTLIKRETHQEEIKSINIYAPNINAELSAGSIGFDTLSMDGEINESVK